MLSRRMLRTIRDSFCLNVNLEEGRLDFNGLLTMGQELTSAFEPDLVSNIKEKSEDLSLDHRN